ncbi:hypothetical protein [Deinococcus misasensis]|uniref:hypothetical protein n=1 Tax=Deinococcus misasensis TaxID=392413 RepID=UPI00055420DC|nr:hypothetical protein [Deinococcus misasensis]
MNGLYMIHKYYGELLMLVPIVVLVWYAIKNKTPMQRVAPIMLDINVLIGALVLLVQKVPVSVWHPVLMIIAMGIGHAVAKKDDRKVVLGAWFVNLILIVVGVRLAAMGVGPLINF